MELGNLDRIAAVAEAGEREEEQAEALELDPGNPAADRAGTVQQSDQDRALAARKTAATALAFTEKGAQWLIDPRLVWEEGDLEEGAEAIGALLEKHDKVPAGGDIPYSEEIGAGLFIGKAIKKMVQAVRELRRQDREERKRKEREAAERSNHGSQRTHGTGEQAHAVPGEERVREESDPEAPGWLAERV